MNKIAFIYQNAFSQTGGIQTFNKYFISALEDISVERDNITVSLASIYDNENDIISSLPCETLGQSKLAAFKYIINQAKKFDTFIFAHVNLAPLAIVVNLLNHKARILFCTHGIEVWQKLPKTTEWIMNKSTILTVSRFSRNELLKYNPNLKDIKLFPNCIKLRENNDNLSNPYDDKNYNILSVTRLSKSEKLKGIDTMIKALPKLIESIPNIKYSVIGKGDDVKRLKELAEKLNVSEYVDFLGFVNDINVYYKHCDIFTLPSKKEGFGIVYLEAMQYKKPVIAVNYGGPTDVIVNGETGYLCEYNQTSSLVDNVYSLYEDKNLSSQLGEKGFKRLMENFTFVHFKKRLAKVLT